MDKYDDPSSPHQTDSIRNPDISDVEPPTNTNNALTTSSNEPAFLDDTDTGEFQEPKKTFTICKVQIKDDSEAKTYNRYDTLLINDDDHDKDDEDDSSNAHLLCTPTIPGTPNRNETASSGFDEPPDQIQFKAHPPCPELKCMISPPKLSLANRTLFLSSISSTGLMTKLVKVRTLLIKCSIQLESKPGKSSQHLSAKQRTRWILSSLR